MSRNIEHCWLATLTFQENIIDKPEAEARWKPVADWLHRRKVDYVGVWQQQARGAWHVHVFIDRYVDINELRPFAVAHGWGPFINLQKVGGYKFPDAERAISYVCRYLSRKHCGHVPLRVRLVVGRRNNSVGTVKFSWIDGMAKAWRVGAELFWIAHRRIPRSEKDRRMAFDFGLRELGFLDFETITVNGPNPYGATP